MRKPLSKLLAVVSMLATPAFAQDEPAPAPQWGDRVKIEKAAVPVVSTWAQLHAVKPIELGENTKVRLGIEAVEAPQFGGVMLYALVEGFHSNEEDVPDRQLGPLNLQIEGPASKKDGRNLNLVVRAQRIMRDWDGIALFCRIVPLKDAGEYKISFATRNDTVLATASIQSKPKSFHAWSVFHSVRWNEIEEAPQDGVLTAYMGYSRFDPAVPYLSGVDPLLVVADPAAKRDTPLPRFLDAAGEARAGRHDEIARVQALVKALSEDDFDLRENASRELRDLLPEALSHVEKARSLSRDVETRSRLDGLIRSVHAATLHIQASKVEAVLTFPGGLHGSWPEDYYLVRWWVNDKPVQPAINKELQEFHKVGAMRMGEQLRLRWNVDWAFLGAKSGDRIAVQFMYCPAGVRKVLTEAEVLTDGGSVLEFGQKPILSNRTEFVLP